MLGVDTIILGGLRQVRQRLAAIAIWGAVYMAVTLLGTFTVMRPIMREQLATIAGGHPVGNPLAISGGVAIFYIGLLLLIAVLFAAGLRAALRPEESALASIRLGMDELRLLGLTLLLMLIFLVVSIVMMVVMGLLIGAVAAISGGFAGQSPGGMIGVVLLVVVMMLVFYGAVFFLQVRLSPAAALTMIRRKIIIGDAWRLTRGRFWVLFGGYLVLGLIVMGVYSIAMVITAGPYFSALLRGGFQPEAMKAITQQQLERQLGTPDPLMILGWIAGAALVGFTIALWSGGIAAATNALLEEEYPDIGAVFE